MLVLAFDGDASNRFLLEGRCGWGIQKGEGEEVVRSDKSDCRASLAHMPDASIS